MTTSLDPARLERELVRRGWNATDLASASGCSAATISAARRGRALTSATISKIARALREAPVLPGIDELLGEELVVPSPRSGDDEGRLGHPLHARGEG